MCEIATVAVCRRYMAMTPAAVLVSISFTWLILIFLPLTLGECDNLSVHFHKELGCSPVYTTDPLCPSSFDCGGLEENRRNFCVVKNLLVDRGYKIETGSGISNKCVPECYCTQNYAYGALTRYRWECTHSDCPQYFRPIPRPGCYWKAELNNCCPWKEVCKKTLFKCLYNGVTYKENDRFYVFRGSVCQKCICRSSFNGTLNDNMCTEVGCDLELHDGEQLAKGCSPVYSKSFCCPLDWRCPEPGDSVEGSGSSMTVAGGLQCKFGNLLLNVGDRVLPDEEADCRCNIPPYVVCTSS